MNRVPVLRAAAPERGPYGSDAAFVDEAVRLHRLTVGKPHAAKGYLLVWLLIQAHEEQTTVGAVLEKLVRTQPSRNDQYGLMRRFRAALAEANG